MPNQKDTRNMTQDIADCALLWGIKHARHILRPICRKANDRCGSECVGSVPVAMNVLMFSFMVTLYELMFLA